MPSHSEHFQVSRLLTNYRDILRKCLSIALQFKGCTHVKLYLCSLHTAISQTLIIIMTHTQYPGVQLKIFAGQKFRPIQLCYVVLQKYFTHEEQYMYIVYECMVEGTKQFHATLGNSTCRTLHTILLQYEGTQQFNWSLRMIVICNILCAYRYDYTGCTCGLFLRCSHSSMLT